MSWEDKTHFPPQRGHNPAKLFANKDLRAKGDNNPAVLSQIRKYESLINQHKEEIENSYRKVCRNICALNGISEKRKEFARMVCEKKLTFCISEKPHLVIFGFDQDQQSGKIWKVHYDKLKMKLGDDRVLMKGEPKDFIQRIRFKD